MGIFGDLFSSSRSAIFVHTDKPQYFAGERVTGTVTLSVSEPLHVDGIYVKVKGYQFVRFRKSIPRTVYDPNAPNNERTVYEDVTFQEKDVFFKRMFCIYSVKSTLMPANFVFPFDFVLDHGLPGAFIFNNASSATYGRVLYKVKAEVVVPGMFKFNLKHNQEVIINEPLRQQISRSDSFKEENVTFCCCISKGHVSMAASIDKNAYSPGEQCKLQLMVDGKECQVDIDQISFALHQSVTMRAGGEKFYETRKLIQSNTPRVPAGGSTTRTIPLNLPYDCTPSCRSSLITCEYTLRVRLSVPWCSDVDLVVPVHIYAPPSANYVAQVVYPESWSYQTMPAVHLNMSSGVQY